MAEPSQPADASTARERSYLEQPAGERDLSQAAPTPRQDEKHSPCYFAGGFDVARPPVRG
jgi:hypothetical protein